MELSVAAENRDGRIQWRVPDQCPAAVFIAAEISKLKTLVLGVPISNVESFNCEPLRFSIILFAFQQRSAAMNASVLLKNIV